MNYEAWNYFWKLLTGLGSLRTNFVAKNSKINARAVKTKLEPDLGSGIPRGWGGVYAQIQTETTVNESFLQVNF